MERFVREDTSVWVILWNWLPERGLEILIPCRVSTLFAAEFLLRWRYVALPRFCFFSFMAKPVVNVGKLLYKRPILLKKRCFTL